MSHDNLLQKNIVIAGLVRNCEKKITKQINILQKAFHVFKNVSFIVVESDSTDKTIDRLEQISSHYPNFYYESVGNLIDTIPTRTDRIAFCRNHYLKIIRDNKQYSDCDYIVMADLDGINNIITSDAVLSCFCRTDWDVCTANQKGPYYDISALIHKKWMPESCFDIMEFYRKITDSEIKANRLSIEKARITIPPHIDWVEVESAFGGLAIYKASILKDIWYETHTYNYCEHLAFHKKLREKKARIFINPAFLNRRTSIFSSVIKSNFNLYYDALKNRIISKIY